MKIQVLPLNYLSNLKPPQKSILIRTTSENEFLNMVYKNNFMETLDLFFDDSSDNQPIDDLNHGIMNTEHYLKIKRFINNNIEAKFLFVSCDAAQSRSPAIAIGILDFILDDQEQTIELLNNNRHWKPNSFVMSFFRKDYYNQL